MLILDVVVQYFNNNPAPKQDFFWKYLPLISPLIVLLTFTGNYIINARVKRSETRRAWYFKAYFEPHLKKVEDFFSNADTLMKAAYQSFTEAQDYWDDTDKISFITQYLSELSDLKRKFTIEVLDVLRPAYPTEFDNLEDILMSFEDVCSKVFDIQTTGEVSDLKRIKHDAYFVYISEINQMKARLISTLSKPALTPERSLSKFFKKIRGLKSNS